MSRVDRTNGLLQQLQAADATGDVDWRRILEEVNRKAIRPTRFREELEPVHDPAGEAPPGCEFEHLSEILLPAEEFRGIKGKRDDPWHGGEPTMRDKIFVFLDDPGSSSGAFLFAVVMLMLVLASTVCFTLTSLPGFFSGEPTYLRMVEGIVMGLFTIEYIVKVWAVPQKLPFFKSWSNAIDLLTIVPYFIELIVNGAVGTVASGHGAFVAARVIRLGSVFQLMKLGRYSTGFRVIGTTMHDSRKALGLLMLLFVIAAFLFAAMIFYAEQTVSFFDLTRMVWVRYGEEPLASPYQNVPAALWWAIVTMTTVGFGDQYPISPTGKTVAGLAALAGLVFVTFPITIISRNFHAAWEESNAHARLPTKGLRDVSLLDTVSLIRSANIRRAEYTQKLRVAAALVKERTDELYIALRLLSEDLRFRPCANVPTPAVSDPLQHVTGEKEIFSHLSSDESLSEALRYRRPSHRRNTASAVSGDGEENGDKGALSEAGVHAGVGPSAQLETGAQSETGGTGAGRRPQWGQKAATSERAGHASDGKDASDAKRTNRGSYIPPAVPRLLRKDTPASSSAPNLGAAASPRSKTRVMNRSMRQFFPMHSDLSEEEGEDATKFVVIERPRRTKREELHILLTDPTSSTKARLVWILLLVLTMAAVAMVCVRSFPAYWLTTPLLLWVLEGLWTVFFTIELFTRFAVSPHKVSFPFHFLNVVDFLSILPWYIELALEGTNQQSVLAYRILAASRLVRVLKFGRFSDGFTLITSTLTASRDVLTLLVFLFVLAVVFCASLVFYAEQSGSYFQDGVWYRYDENIQEFGDPSVKTSPFQSIPQSMWWSVQTLTTVGYGDVFPVTPLGKAFGGIAVVGSCLVVAFPLTIISTNFGLAWAKLQRRKRRKKTTRYLTATTTLHKFVGLIAKENSSVKAYTDSIEEALNSCRSSQRNMEALLRGMEDMVEDILPDLRIGKAPHSRPPSVLDASAAGFGGPDTRPSTPGSPGTTRLGQIRSKSGRAPWPANTSSLGRAREYVTVDDSDENDTSTTPLLAGSGRRSPPPDLSDPVRRPPGLVSLPLEKEMASMANLPPRVTPNNVPPAPEPPGIAVPLRRVRSEAGRQDATQTARGAAPGGAPPPLAPPPGPLRPPVNTRPMHHPPPPTVDELLAITLAPVSAVPPAASSPATTAPAPASPGAPAALNPDATLGTVPTLAPPHAGPAPGGAADAGDVVGRPPSVLTPAEVLARVEHELGTAWLPPAGQTPSAALLNLAPEEPKQ